MEDDVFGVVYLIETAQQFWSELEEILSPPRDATLAYLDSRLRSFVTLCATYHEKYLSTPAQLDYSCQLLLDSDFFSFHSERSCDLLLGEAKIATDPHVLFILYNIFLARGRRHVSFFRSQPLWEPLLPLLMDYIVLEFHGDTSSDYIEARLRYLAVEMLFELCRLQKLTSAQLEVFTDTFIDDLFDLVENSRSNDMLSYSVIRFLVCLNEQFMVASVQSAKAKSQPKSNGEASISENRVLVVLMRRLHTSKSFGENLIFMLNRADDTPEDQALQLLILKMLYLLFTTMGTQEYFYTNDLRVLVDVFIRELNNLSDENESLKHTYLRVLFPLLTNTQLRENPYKPVLVHHTLQNFVSHAHIREIDATTRRLVDRCLSGDWCKHISLPTPPNSTAAADEFNETSVDTGSPTSEVQLTASKTMGHAASVTSAPELSRQRSLQRSASAEQLRKAARDARNGKETVHPGPTPFSALSRAPSNKVKKGHGLTAHMASLTIVPHSDSNTSLASVAGATDSRSLTLPMTPRSESGMISPTPISPLSSSPPSDGMLRQHNIAQPQARHPAHQRVAHAHPIRSRSVEPQTPALDSPRPPTPPRASAAVPVDLPQIPSGIPPPPPRNHSPVSVPYHPTAPAAISLTRIKSKSPPPPPPRRRKPPAPPGVVVQGEGGETIHTIATSASRSSPLNPNSLANLRTKKQHRNAPPAPSR